LPALITRYLQEPQRGQEQGAAGHQLIAIHSGATARTVALLRGLV
jgi:hypothetical protein